MGKLARLGLGGGEGGPRRSGGFKGGQGGGQVKMRLLRGGDDHCCAPFHTSYRAYLHHSVLGPWKRCDKHPKGANVRLTLALAKGVVGMAKLDVDFDASCIMTNAYQPCLSPSNSEPPCRNDRRRR